VSTSMTAVPTIQPPATHSTPVARAPITAAEARSRAAHPTNAVRRRRTEAARPAAPARQPTSVPRATSPHPAGTRRRTAETDTHVCAGPGRGKGAIPVQTRRRARSRTEWVSCCGLRWEGVERAHCCRRTGGCGRVFDTPRLFDRHRRVRGCLDPAGLDLIHTGGVWRSA
jgi:hypothetical protein